MTTNRVLFRFAVTCVLIVSAGHWAHARPSKAGKLHEEETGLDDVRTVPHIGLPDIAIASYDIFGPVIYYNPVIVQSVGPDVADFFYVHEQAHHKLPHFLKQQRVSNPYAYIALSKNLERKADQFAARVLAQSNPEAVARVAEFFESMARSRPPWYRDPTHPHPSERAEIVRQAGREFASRTVGQLSGVWVRAEEHDVEFRKISIDWGDKRSGWVTVKVAATNPSDDEEYRVRLKCAVVRVSRSTREKVGEVVSMRKTVMIKPGESTTATFKLRWATRDWTPNQYEMPGVSTPDPLSRHSERGDGHALVWRRILKDGAKPHTFPIHRFKRQLLRLVKAGDTAFIPIRRKLLDRTEVEYRIYGLGVSLPGIPPGKLWYYGEEMGGGASARFDVIRSAQGKKSQVQFDRLLHRIRNALPDTWKEKKRSDGKRTTITFSKGPEHADLRITLTLLSRGYSKVDLVCSAPD